MIRHPTLAVVTLVVAAVAAFAVVDPFHLLVAPWFAGITVGLGVVLLTVWIALAITRRLARALVAVAGGLVVLVWGAFTWASIVISPGLSVIREVPGPPGSRLRLAIVEVQTIAVDGPTYSVRLRAGSGLLTQDSPVWVGLSEGAAPRDVRFAGDTTVEVIGSGGCGYRSTVSPVTLAVDPVHRPLRLDGC
ncbi:hypothetical protein GCM10009836_20770 [Pseudonocardia ailaonensis]|uniref:DUF4131 domain-containing protein n=1 Tax=Pseudonocardia ailaonensis TaxID=367279 RepID=A0ABN2MXL8_9PSEU